MVVFADFDFIAETLSYVDSNLNLSATVGVRFYQRQIFELKNCIAISISCFLYVSALTCTKRE